MCKETMPRVTFNRLSTKRKHYTKKRTSVLTRAKYAPKNARVNRSLIKSNTYAIKAIRKMIPPAVFCDFQYTNAESPFSAIGDFVSFQVAEMMDPSIWNAVMRKDDNAIASSRTLLKWMSLNLRTSLGEANWCQVSTFIVTLRKDASNRDIFNQGLIQGDDYITNSQGFNPTLNSRLFKCLYVKHMSLMSAAWQGEKAVQGNAELIGNPMTTYKKSQCNLKLNYRIRQPLGSSWKLMTQQQFPPQQRLYLLMFFKGNTNDVDDNPVRVDWDAHYVTYNSA